MLQIHSTSSESKVHSFPQPSSQEGQEALRQGQPYITQTICSNIRKKILNLYNIGKILILQSEALGAIIQMKVSPKTFKYSSHIF